MSYQIKRMSADGNQQSKKIRRRFVPISFEISRQGQHITFEQKLPFKTAKVVGLMTVVSEKPKELPEFPIPIGGGPTS